MLSQINQMKTQLVEMIQNADRARANDLLDLWARENGYLALLTEVLEPALVTIGNGWHNSESYTLAQAYVAAKVAEDTMAKLALSLKDQPPVAVRGIAVIGNIEDDFLSLGRRMVGVFLRAAGWEVHDLGNDVAPADFVEKAIGVGARVIGASASMVSTGRNIEKLRREIDAAGQGGRLQLAVGGAVFLVYPGMVEEVGGDGTARSAIMAPELFATLWERSLKRGE